MRYPHLSRIAATLVLTVAFALLGVAASLPKYRAPRSATPAGEHDAQVQAVANRTHAAGLAVAALVQAAQAGDDTAAPGRAAWRTVAELEVALADLLEATAPAATMPPGDDTGPAPTDPPDVSPPIVEPPTSTPGTSDSAARARAIEITDEARVAVAAAFAALRPGADETLVEDLQYALTGAPDADLDALFDGARVTVEHAGGEWRWRVGDDEDAPWVKASKASVALGEAVNVAGPWGQVVLPDGAPPIAGGAWGSASWNSVATAHPGPTLIRGGTLLGVNSRGSGAPALWVEGSTILCPVGAKATVDVHLGVKLGTPWAFRGCTFGAEDPTLVKWGLHPHLWHVRAYPQGPLAFVACAFTETPGEHSIYASNVQGALLVDGCEFAPSPRCNVQVTDRKHEGPAGHGPVAVVRSTLHVTRKQLGGAGGGGSLTIAGHLGPVAALDITFTTGPSAYPWDSHNSLAVLWREPDTATSGPYTVEGGWGCPELAFAGAMLVTPEGHAYKPDREPVKVSGIRTVWLEAPAGFPTIDGSLGMPRAVTLSINDQGATHPGYEIGELHFEPGRPGAPRWWTLIGKGWASAMGTNLEAGAYGPLATE